MSKNLKNELQLEIETLRLQNSDLKKENQNLQLELDKLNENTVICSMNDMKIQFEELKESTIPIYLYEHLKDYYKKCFSIIKAIDKITFIVIDDIFELKEIIIDENSTKLFKNKSIENQLNSINNSLLMIPKIINRDEYEWNENECYCEFSQN